MRLTRSRRITIAGLALAGLVVSAGYSRHRSAAARVGSATAQRGPAQCGFEYEPQPQTGRAEFFFTRAIYSGGCRGYDPSWAVDFPKADRQFLIGLRRLTSIDAYELENPVRLDDPELRRYPFLYALEVGDMMLTEAEIVGLREYLLAGGFVVIDDFWGSWEWRNFERAIMQVLPGYPIVDLPMDHPILSTFYEIDEILQVPARGRGMYGRPTWEEDGYVPALKGIFDEKGRLMVVINWNTDLGDAWEWADDPMYPLRFSNFAYQLGINMIIYGMSR